MRTPEVEIAISNTKAGVYCTDDADTLAAEVERLEAHVAELKALREQDRSERIAIMEVANIAAEAAEARVRELEAQYACKRYHGGEGPADDTLYSCQICGLTVDISKGHCEPTIEFTMQGRSDKKTKKLAELEAQNARLRAAQFKLRAAAQHAEIWLTSCLECKEWMWSEHQHEAATEARDELKAALNAEETST